MISKSITSFILFPIILCGCLTKGKEYTGDLKVTLPSIKELQFIDSLRSKGFTNVVLDILSNISLKEKYSSACIINCSSIVKLTIKRKSFYRVKIIEKMVLLTGYSEVNP